MTDLRPLRKLVQTWHERSKELWSEEDSARVEAAMQNRDAASLSNIELEDMYAIKGSQVWLEAAFELQEALQELGAEQLAAYLRGRSEEAEE